MQKFMLLASTVLLLSNSLVGKTNAQDIMDNLNDQSLIEDKQIHEKRSNILNQRNLYDSQQTSSSSKQSYMIKKDLVLEQWTFKAGSWIEWFKANVPSTVHLDLMDVKKIENPYHERNAESVRWVEDEEWTYKASFEVTAEEGLLDQDTVELVFEGLDTYANIFVNEVQVGTAFNYHRTWVFDIYDNLKLGTNTLQVKFAKIATKEAELQKKYSPLRFPVQFSYTRKPHFHYGWDIAPRLQGVGIFKPVYIQAFSSLKIDGILMRNSKITSTKMKQVQLFGRVELINIDNRDVTLEIIDVNSNKQLFKQDQTFEQAPEVMTPSEILISLTSTTTTSSTTTTPPQANPFILFQWVSAKINQEPKEELRLQTCIPFQGRLDQQAKSG